MPSDKQINFYSGRYSQPILIDLLSLIFIAVFDQFDIDWTRIYTMKERRIPYNLRFDLFTLINGSFYQWQEIVHCMAYCHTCFQ